MTLPRVRSQKMNSPVPKPLPKRSSKLKSGFIECPNARYRIGREKVSDKGIASAQARVDPLRRQTGRSRSEIWDVMTQTFAERYDATPREVTEDELSRAEALAEEKFKTQEWIHRVP